MNGFVVYGAVEFRNIVKLVYLRNNNLIQEWTVVCPVALLLSQCDSGMAYIIMKDFFCVLIRLQCVWRGNSKPRLHPFALVDMEDGVILQQRHLLLFSGILIFGIDELKSQALRLYSPER